MEQNKSYYLVSFLLITIIFILFFNPSSSNYSKTESILWNLIFALALFIPLFAYYYFLKKSLSEKKLKLSLIVMKYLGITFAITLALSLLIDFMGSSIFSSGVESIAPYASMILGLALSIVILLFVGLILTIIKIKEKSPETKKIILNVILILFYVAFILSMIYFNFLV